MPEWLSDYKWFAVANWETVLAGLIIPILILTVLLSLQDAKAKRKELKSCR